jgi:hypothetical protein
VAACATWQKPTVAELRTLVADDLDPIAAQGGDRMSQQATRALPDGRTDVVAQHDAHARRLAPRTTRPTSPPSSTGSRSRPSPRACCSASSRQACSSSAWQANRAPPDNTEQLVRVQNIQSTLYRADALATNAFLIGGLEPPAQRKAYDDAIDQVSRSITDAAEAQSADRDVLADLNTTVNRYSTSVELARANNRQGFPVGAEYLLTAGGPAPRRGRTDHHRSRRCQRPEVRGRDGRPPAVAAAAAGLLAFAVLFWVNRQLAARFRRRFNIGIVAAAGRRSRSSRWSRSWSARASAATTRTCSTAATRTPSTRRPPAPPATTPRPTRACA